jgi:hypothetical protein
MRMRLAFLVVLVLVVGSCRPEPAHEAYPREGHEEEAGEGHGVEGEAGAGEAHVDAFTVDGVLRSVPAVQAVEMHGPGGEPFKVALRTTEVGHYPCVSCHIRPIGQKEVALGQMHTPRPEHEGATRIDCNGCHDPSRPGGLVIDCTECHEREGLRELMPSRTAHLTIELVHPSGEYRTCLTCHSPVNPEMLVLRDGRLASLDEAYRLCQGCHYAQTESWANGAHGKRLAGWAGERTILSCTGCHDPHDPLFPIRRPVTFPKIARPGEGR